VSEALNPAAFFDCQKCGQCCKGFGGTFVTDRDVENISGFIGVEQDYFLSHYCHLSGGRPLIRTQESGYCVFWDELCTIHEVKPRMCKIWPFIESVLVDPSNWTSIQSVCPGVREKANLQDLAACVKRVLEEHDRGPKAP
jgi:Fe-S-cluster containining protein